MNYRKIKVYTGYNENQITSSSFVFECDLDVTFAATCIRDMIAQGMLNDEFTEQRHREFMQQLVDESYSHIKIVNDDIAIIDHGCEDVVCVISENSTWFNLVTQQNQWDSSTWEAWNNVISAPACIRDRLVGA